MWKFYRVVVVSAVQEFWSAADRVLTGIAIVSFFAILLSRTWGEHIVTAWNGFSPWWSVIPMALIVAYRLLRANYEQFSKVKRERDVGVAKLELKTGLPPYPPVVVPHGYGQQEHGSFGLFIANDGYPAYDVSIPAVAIGATMSRLTFDRKRTRLIDKEGKQFFEAWIDHPLRGGRDGGQLSKEMVAARIKALNVAIVYKDREFRWYKSNCVIERDVGVGVGLSVSFVGQELMPSPPS